MTQLKIKINNFANSLDTSTGKEGVKRIKIAEVEMRFFNFSFQDPHLTPRKAISHHIVARFFGGVAGFQRAREDECPVSDSRCYGLHEIMLDDIQFGFLGE